MFSLPAACGTSIYQTGLVFLSKTLSCMSSVRPPLLISLLRKSRTPESEEAKKRGVPPRKRAAQISSDRRLPGPGRG